MSPVIHALVAWIVAALILTELNDRRLAILAGVLPDLDGAPVLWSSREFHEHHHTWGHSYVFAIPLCILLAVPAKERGKTFVAGLGAFTMHLVADIVGTNWITMPLWPLSEEGTHAGHWLTEVQIYAILNPIAFFVVMAVVYMVMYHKEVSPMEYISAKWDKRFVGELIYPFKYKCDKCGDRATLGCEKCGERVCNKHIDPKMRYVCVTCGVKEDMKAGKKKARSKKRRHGRK